MAAAKTWFATPFENGALRGTELLGAFLNLGQPLIHNITFCQATSQVENLRSLLDRMLSVIALTLTEATAEQGLRWCTQAVGVQRLFEQVHSWELSSVSGVFVAFFTLVLHEVDSVL